MSSAFWSFIAVWVALVPCPGTGDNRFQIGIAWSPTQFVVDLFRRSNQSRRIAGTAGRLFSGQFVIRYLARHVDYLPHTVALPVAQVVGHGFACIEGLQRQYMGGGKVLNMNIVADAGAVGCRVIGAIDFDRLALA